MVKYLALFPQITYTIPMSINKSDFLRVYQEFKLGNLSTESSHPKTRNLSNIVKSDLSGAISLLQEIDRDCLSMVAENLEQIFELSQEIASTLKAGGKLYLSGCGATGRLALAIETFYRFETGKDHVIGFMAGGDYALIKSVESFEDKMDFGQRQLDELGFGAQDLLLAITEGGETSFVIGSALRAANQSNRSPYFIYCNPDHELVEIERSRLVLNNSKIKKLSLRTGPMAISGSTRMQATTVQMLAVALALFVDSSDKEIFMNTALGEIQALQSLDFSPLENIILKEASIYQEGGLLTYLCSSKSAITVLTDTTERSPTFSLAPFEKSGEGSLSLAFLSILGAKDSKSAWESLLGRKPRAINWKELEFKIDESEIYLFDISEASVPRREMQGAQTILLKDEDDFFQFCIGELETKILKQSAYGVFNQIGLKMALNILSTLVMGLMERYEGNLMTFVRPSNLKLIDRAARYVLELSQAQKLELSYFEVIEELFNQIERLGPDEPIVLKTFSALKRD